MTQFVEATTHEVVIASLRRFVGFEGERAHVELMAFVEESVGVGNIYPLNPVSGEARTTLRDCWDMGRRVVVLYGEEAPQKDNALFWPIIQASIAPVAHSTLVKLSHTSVGSCRVCNMSSSLEYVMYRVIHLL